MLVVAVVLVARAGTERALVRIVCLEVIKEHNFFLFFSKGEKRE